MKTAVTKRGQTVIPSQLRKRYAERKFDKNRE
jgi:bifunctional DNA-binding transcriptional regulator/antitoxin component of YhaV-PrlF toxin-antitoxin module